MGDVAMRQQRGDARRWMLQLNLLARICPGAAPAAPPKPAHCKRRRAPGRNRSDRRS